MTSAPEAVEAVCGPARKGPVCGCLPRVRDLLHPMNGTPGLCFETGGAIVFVKPITSDGPRPPIVTASYCPFCGQAYDEPAR